MGAPEMPDDYMQAACNHRWYVITAEDQIIASGFIDQLKAKLEALFVMPNYQGRGIEKMMLHHLMST